MYLYHYVLGKRRGVYSVEPGTPIEQVFKEVNTWPGTKLILVKGGVASVEEKAT